MSEEIDAKEHALKRLEMLRVPFPLNQISSLPKPTKQQTDEVKRDYKAGARCSICNGWHHPKVAHLDYVGHAAITDRLLDVDPAWTWSFLAVDSLGMPVIDNDGGMWISLTVCGVTRIGYGDAQGKTGGNAMKERIGDALRNAAMRFGCALELWHKGDLHVESDIEPSTEKSIPSKTLTDLDKDWIRAVAQDPSVLEQIEDPMYKQFIKLQVGI